MALEDMPEQPQTNHPFWCPCRTERHVGMPSAYSDTVHGEMLADPVYVLVMLFHGLDGQVEWDASIDHRIGEPTSGVLKVGRAPEHSYRVTIVKETLTDDS